MKFSLDFLKQFVAVKIPAKELAGNLTSAGLEVETLEKKPNDWIFTAEVTTNRYDWLSVIGIAQEAAAVLGEKINLTYPPVKTTPDLKKRNIFIEDKKDCPYYLGREIKNVEINSSRTWIKNLLLNCGLASVNNIVDITNYCMLKWGNPLHAFDLDKIQGDIYIRRAKKGEKFLGIDQKERILDKDNLVIADSKKIIALAGIMGGKNTEITSQTKNIFLEAAKFSPATIRRSCRQVGLSTESSYRFERRISVSFLEYASQEANNLIVKIAGGKFTGSKKAGKKTKEKLKAITVNLSEMENYLGIKFKLPELKKILRSLNFTVEQISAGKIKVKPALSRFDIKNPVDVYEEFARIYGYDRIGPKIPSLAKFQKGEPLLNKKQKSWQFKNKIREFIALGGFLEIITYSMENKEELSLVTEKKGISLKNPLRSQENSLRPTLLLGMIKTMKHNLNRDKNNLNFFEIADIYIKGDKNDIRERPFLSLGVSGGQERFFLLKGLVLELLDYLNIEPIEFKEATRKSFSNSLEIIVRDKTLGFLAKLDKKIKEQTGLKEEVFLAELDLKLLEEYRKVKIFKPFSKFPIVWRDISLALQKNIKFAKIRKIIENESQYLSDLKLIDTYKGKGLPDGYFAFTLRIFYQSKEKTLNSEEIDTYHNKIREKLNSQNGVVLR